MAAPGSYRVVLAPLDFVVCAAGDGREQSSRQDRQDRQEEFEFQISGLALLASWREFLSLLILCRRRRRRDPRHGQLAQQHPVPSPSPSTTKAAPAIRSARAGRPIVTESRLGFLLTDAPKLERNFRGDGVADAQLRRDLGAAVGRAALRSQPLQRDARAAGREESAGTRARSRVPRRSMTASASATSFPISRSCAR